MARHRGARHPRKITGFSPSMRGRNRLCCAARRRRVADCFLEAIDPVANRGTWAVAGYRLTRFWSSTALRRSRSMRFAKVKATAIKPTPPVSSCFGIHFGDLQDTQAALSKDKPLKMIILI